MQTLNELETAPLPTEEEEQSHTRRLLIGVLCALIVTGLLVGGYFFYRKRVASEAAVAAVKPKVIVPPKVEVSVDEVTQKDKQSLIGGTVHNISDEALRDVSVELGLRHRTGGVVENRTVPLDASDLAPDGKGRYELALSTKDYSSATLLRVVAGDNRADVPFKTLPGTPRPPEAPPAAKTMTLKRPAPRGDGFINTPDTPIRVP